MVSIAKNLKQILTAVYGRDVRQAIHDSIQQCGESAEKALKAAESALKRSEIALIACEGMLDPDTPYWEKLTDGQIFEGGVENYYNQQYVLDGSQGNFSLETCPGDCQYAVLNVSGGETYAVKTYFDPNHIPGGFAVCGGDMESYGFTPAEPKPEPRTGWHFYIVTIPDEGCNRLLVNNHLYSEGNIEMYKWRS